MQVLLLEQNKSYKWYIKRSKWLLYDVIHNPKVMHLTFRLHFIRGVMEKHKLKVPLPIYRCHLLNHLLTHSLTEHHFEKRKKAGTSDIVCACSGHDNGRSGIQSSTDCEIGLCFNSCFKT